MESITSMFAHLDSMQKSGSQNMFHGPQELRLIFGLSKSESYEVFRQWTVNFEKGEDK